MKTADTPEHIFNASACGDNCASWILKIAQKKDLTIRLGYLMDFGSDNFDIEIYNNKVHYFLTVKRNITILQGNSATGKTELIRLIGEHEANGASSGITLKCDVKCTVLTAVDWELRLSAMHKNIVFIDESAAFVKSKRFAEMVRGSDNYFVIVTRDDLSQLPYSVDEIYGLRNVSDNQKYKILPHYLFRGL